MSGSVWMPRTSDSRSLAALAVSRWRGDVRFIVVIFERAVAWKIGGRKTTSCRQHSSHCATVSAACTASACRRSGYGSRRAAPFVCPAVRFWPRRSISASRFAATIAIRAASSSSRHCCTCFFHAAWCSALRFSQY